MASWFTGHFTEFSLIFSLGSRHFLLGARRVE